MVWWLRKNPLSLREFRKPYPLSLWKAGWLPLYLPVALRIAAFVVERKHQAGRYKLLRKTLLDVLHSRFLSSRLSNCETFYWGLSSAETTLQERERARVVQERERPHVEIGGPSMRWRRRSSNNWVKWRAKSTEINILYSFQVQHLETGTSHPLCVYFYATWFLNIWTLTLANVRSVAAEANFSTLKNSFQITKFWGMLNFWVVHVEFLLLFFSFLLFYFCHVWFSAQQLCWLISFYFLWMCGIILWMCGIIKKYEL